VTVWLRRPIARSGDPCTHALVIGVSRYDFLPAEPGLAGDQSFGLSQATTPASSALRFAEWLRNEYNSPDAQLGTVRLLLGASDAEKQANPELATTDAEVLDPTASNVEAALNEWCGDCLTNRDHVGVLYVSGHGIQQSKEGSIVLLQDFNDPRDGLSILKRAIDVEGVRQGMSRTDAARRQFYFVDSCRTRPELFQDYYSATAGVTIDVPAHGAVDVSAVHFGASSGTLALGHKGRGTLFGAALLECLRGGAYTSTASGWGVTQASLIASLGPRVDELAQQYDSEQKATAGGEFIDTVFHVAPAPPSVALRVALAPPAAATSATAELYDDEADSYLFRQARFDPELAEEVPAGVYVLNVAVDPANGRYRDRSVPVVAAPPRCRKEVSVAV
jgi:hypothetical protein